MNSEVPEIRTRRLLLSGFQEGDISDVFAYASNPNVARLTSWQTHQSEEDSRTFVNWAVGKASSERGRINYTWAIRHGPKPSTSVIGSIHFTQTSEDAGRIDYALAEPHWNKGLMTEAAKAVVDWVFEHLPELNELRSGGLSENVGSIRVMEKCGMHLNQRYKTRFDKFGGEKQEVSEYMMTRTDWLKAKSAT